MKLSGIWLTLLLPAVSCFGASQAIFDQDQNQWTLNNGLIRAVFQLTPDGYFLTREVSNLQSGDRWKASVNRTTSPVRLQAGDDVFDAQTPFRMLSHGTQSIAQPPGMRESIVLLDLAGRAQITVVFEL